MKFGIGEFEGKTNGSPLPSIVEMRTLFLNRASKLYPAMTERMANDLYPLYRKIKLFAYEANDVILKKRPHRNDRYGWYTSCRPPWEIVEKAWADRPLSQPFSIKFDAYHSKWDSRSKEWILDDSDSPSAYQDEFISEFVEKMFEWSDAFHLSNSWCRSHVFETLDFWTYESEYLNSRTWLPMPRNFLLFYYPLTVGRFTSQEFSFKYVTLFPNLGFRNEEEETITTKFKQELKDFLDGRIREAESQGFYKTKELYKDGERFDLLARFVIGAETYGQITEKKDADGIFIGDDTSTVRKAVRTAAKAIQLRID